MAILRRRDEDDLDKAFLAKINHGRENLQKTAPMRDEAWEFYRGNHYAFVDRGKLRFLPSGYIGVGTGKDPNRARQSRNFIFDVVLREASQASQRVPSYQVVPSTTDPDDVGAARLSEKVALYGYHRWGLRKATIDAVIHAVVGGEAFAWAYFDNTIGPFIEDEEGSVGQGDVRVRIYGGNETYWVPGLRFEDSPWHCVEQAMLPENVKALPGYAGGELTPDANTRPTGRNHSDKGKLVLVTHYLERPCPEYPEGRWITLANQKRILPERPYPGTGYAPVLRQLVYAPDADSDRNLGLVPQLLDAMRSKDDAENKAVEWKNHAIFPAWAVQPGVMKKQRRTTDPGKIYEIPNPDQNLKVIEPPAIPESLFRMADRATDDLLRIAGQQDIPPGVESGRAIQALIEKNLARAAMFTATLAEWHANVMHDCLKQVQDNYTEDRLIAVKGDFGWESIEDFKGAQLRDQVDVRVFADSIEPQTRQARDQKIMNYASMGAIDPVEAMTAMETGATEGLIRSYAQDEARAGRIIQRIKDGTFLEMPDLPTGRTVKVAMMDPMTGQPAVDPMTGQPQMQDTGQPEMAPGWMPRYSDNLGLFRTIFEDWMKSEEFERVANLVPEGGTDTIGTVAATIYAGILQLEAEKAGEAEAAQAAQAEAMGMQNASRPQGNGKPQPSLPSLSEGATADTP